MLLGRLPATRRWERADQDLLELFANAMAAAIRNAQLFATVEDQNRQLLDLDAAKDDFLRGVSHNLQTPLTSIRAYAEQLDAARPDRRLGIIAEQTERLSRMVRQLLTVTRLESGALKPRSEVVSLATRVRKAWEALGTEEVAFELADGAGGWLAVADPDQLDQVLWALLDNALKYGASSPVRVTIGVDRPTSRLGVTIADGGAGIAEADRDRLFARFARGSDPALDGGSGLGLYVSRELCRAMGGELVLEPSIQGRGAAFTITLAGRARRRGLTPRQPRVVAGPQRDLWRTPKDHLASAIRRPYDAGRPSGVQPDQPPGTHTMSVDPRVRARAPRFHATALQRRRPRTRAQAVVEFALVLPVLLLLVVVAVDFGRLFFSYIQISNAAREGANFGSGAPTDIVGITARVAAEKNAQGQAGEGTPVVTTACADASGSTIACSLATGGGGGGNTVTVSVRVPFTFLTPLINGFFGGDLDVTQLRDGDRPWIRAGRGRDASRPAARSRAPTSP